MIHTAIIQDGGIFIPNIDLSDPKVTAEVVKVDLLDNGMTELSAFPFEQFKLNIRLVKQDSVNIAKDKDSYSSERPLYNLMQKWKSENPHDEDWSDAFNFSDEPEMELDVF